jgi:hypothetical protein
MKNHEGEGIRRNLFLGTVLFAFVTGLLLAGCTDFYSSTWGEGLARDPSSVKVTASNINELLKDANGDPKASRAILEKVRGSKDPALQAAAVKAANQAAGLTQLVLSNLDAVTGDNARDTDSLTKLGETILGEARNNDITGIALDIAGTLPVKDTSNGPRFDGSFAKSVSTSDLTLLLVTMMMAEATEASDDFGAYAAKWGSEKTIDDPNLQSKELVIAAIANEVISRPDSNLGEMLKDLVGAL